VQEQSLRGLTDNIFRQLAVSEYVVFVDFKREQFANSAEYRGSLFTHQELAVAAFLDLEVLAFQEEGVRQLDGMIRFLQANAFRFDDRASLPQLVTAKVKERGWSPVWRKTLRLERDPTQFVDAESVDAYGRPAGVRRFFQGNVMNRHRSMVAAHAYVYLDRLVRVSDGEALPLKTIELKWAGYIYPNAVIRPGFPREFDCCWVHHDFPSQARFAVFADSPEYSPVINGPGQFHLRFTAVAERFEPQSLDLSLTLGTTIDEVRLVPADAARQPGNR